MNTTVCLIAKIERYDVVCLAELENQKRTVKYRRTSSVDLVIQNPNDTRVTYAIEMDVLDFRNDVVSNILELMGMRCGHGTNQCKSQ